MLIELMAKDLETSGGWKSSVRDWISYYLKVLDIIVIHIIWL